MPSPFLQSIQNEIRLRGYSYKTEKTYMNWIRQYIYFNRKQHPKELGTEEVKAFLTHLVVDRHVAVNTQKSALSTS